MRNETSTNLLKEIENKLSGVDAKPFAVFDFDNTCIVNDIGEATFAYICGHELLRDRTLLGGKDESGNYHERVFRTYHALLEEGKTKAAYMLCAKIFSGFTPGEAEATALAAIQEEGKKIGSKMLYDIHIERGLVRNEKAMALMEHLRAHGVNIWVVSASPEPSVRAAMRHFGIEAELIGVRSALRGGVFASELEQPMPIMEGKVDCIEKYIDAEHIPLLGIGDSMNDLPMLELSNIKVVVYRGNELSRVARERGWYVI
jgi:HAD superfamily phosphoserine phosphatase-like hydrolase